MPERLGNDHKGGIGKIHRKLAVLLHELNNPEAMLLAQ